MIHIQIYGHGQVRNILAATEAVLIHFCNVVRDRQFRQTIAVVERSVIDLCKLVRNRNTGNRITIRESRRSKGSQLAGKFNILQTGTTGESTTADRGYSVGNGYTDKIDAVLKGPCTDICDLRVENYSLQRLFTLHFRRNTM